jgi:hypothetical protein
MAWSLCLFGTVLLVGLVAFQVALPRVPGIPMGGHIVARSLEPFGRDLGVGLTLGVLVAVAIGGSLVLKRLRAWWSLAILVALTLFVGLAFLSFAALTVSDVFI